MAPLAVCEQDNVWKNRAILIVICPVVALMKDQVNRLQVLGINAAYVSSDQLQSVLSKIENGEYNLVFMSPESTLDNERWRSMVSNPVYTESLMGIAVDEVHCVTQWGQSNRNRERLAFRKWYSRLNKLRSLSDGVPFMALIATATTLTKRKIRYLLSDDITVFHIIQIIGQRTW
jgi:superfamily II DNA helicase RecQ